MKRLRHKVTGMIYRWTPVTAQFLDMEEIDEEPGPPPTERKKAPKKKTKGKTKKPVVPEVSADDLVFESEATGSHGELSDK